VSGARRPIVAGNWKMHLDRAGAEALCLSLATRAGRSVGPEVVVFPSFPLLAAVARALAGSPVAFGGQDLHPEPAGAHTGDVSGAQLADAGCLWVLCGHSERRRDHGEDDELVARKARAALSAGLQPIVCLGETLAERRAESTLAVLARQVAAVPADPRVAVAYEPVWAIGTGETASPEVAQEAHAFLRAELGRRAGEGFAAGVRLLYGGSVTPATAPELALQEDVDGFLVGGASLDAARFSAILSAFAA
jgi:triosephosphate isomerase